MAEKVFYVLSNGGGSSYPDNTLTYFKNKLPVPLEIDRRYEIGVQAFGFSTVFKNIITPKDPSIPSLIITDCHRLDRTKQPCVMNGIFGCESTVKFDFISKAVECLNESGEEKCFLNMTIHRRQCNRLDDCEDTEVSYSTAPESNKPVVSPNSNKCTYWFYYLNSNKTFGIKELRDLQARIKADTNIDLKYSMKRLKFDLTDEDAYRHFNFKWVMLHPTFIESFNFKRHILFKEFLPNQDIEGMPYQVEMESDSRVERSVNYRGHLYRVYLLAKKIIRQRFVQHTIRSRPFELNKPLFPKYVKISSDQIVPQILNNTYSNDLLVFSPEFTQEEKYIYREIEAVDYIPLLNSTISEFKIKLVDENNEQLNLAEGHATVVKLIIKEMDSNKQSFNVRLTSSPSDDYPDNTSSKFKVQLPTALQLGDDWRVSINSISHSTVYSTFLRDVNTRSISFKENGTGQLYRTSFNSQQWYYVDEIISHLNDFMEGQDLGKCTLIDGYITLSFAKLGKLAISSLTAKVLGFNGKNIGGKQFFNCSDISSPNFQDGQYILKADNLPDIGYLHPNYMLIYSNIVKSTIVGGQYAKLLRIAPLVMTDLDYTITEFKSKERYQLDLSEVKTIEIALCSHDGELIDFSSPHDTIVNLEFSNYSE